MSPLRRWLPHVVSFSLVLLFVVSGYALADNVGPWSDSDTRAPVMTVRADRVEPVVDDATDTAAEAAAAQRVEQQRQKEIAREARIARRVAAREAKLRAERRAAQRKATLKSTPYTFRIGSFNVLGSQHTAPGGQRRNFASGAARMPGTVALTRAHGVDILGTQELQDDQYRSLSSQTGMAGWPGLQWGSRETVNSILYDPDVFEFVEGSSYSITFMSRSRPQPILRLRHKATTRELYVVNTHPSAGGGKYAAERARAHAVTVGVVNELAKSGLPVLLTGDMNDREAFYCAVVAKTALTASNGGGAGCAPPPGPLPVDWVVGSEVSWSNYQRDTSPVSRRISDHFFISATATVQ